MNNLISRRLNYHHLRYFRAVAREGNLTRAAEALHVSQSAVSVQIRKLEDALGHDLFDRRGRGLELTPAGRTVLDYADSIFGLGDELISVLGEEGAARRVLRVGVLATLSRNFQIAFLGPVLNRDDIALQIRSGSVREMVAHLEAHRLDVVLTNFLPPRDDDSTWLPHTIDEQPVSLIGRPTDRPERSLEELLAEEPVVAPTVESGIRTRFDAFAARNGVEPRIVAEVDDMAMLRLVARAHEGISVLPPIVVHDELENGSLVELARVPGLVESFYAITAPRHTPDELLVALVRTAENARHE